VYVSVGTINTSASLHAIIEDVLKNVAGIDATVRRRSVKSISTLLL